MIHAGDTIENPVTGERIVFNKTSAETGGEAVRHAARLRARRLRHRDGRPHRLRAAVGSHRHRAGDHDHDAAPFAPWSRSVAWRLAVTMPRSTIQAIVRVTTSRAGRHV